MTDAWSITDGYNASDGTWLETPDAVRTALRAAFGGTDRDSPPEPPGMWFVEHGTTPAVWRPVDIILEDGTRLDSVATLPPDLPMGYHRIDPGDGWPLTDLIVTPKRCPAVGGRRWGWQLQQYGVRSRRSWGTGDFDDLRRLINWVGNHGGRAVLVNPLHAPLPGLPVAPSPYAASSRVFTAPLLLAPETITGWHQVADRFATELDRARALNSRKILDRDESWRMKEPALEALFAWMLDQGDERTRFDRWRASQPALTEKYGAYVALTEVLGPWWPQWPLAVRRGETGAVAEAVAPAADRAAFAIWCQWWLAQQREAALDRRVSLIGDLAVGFAPDGFDAWAFQDVLALDVGVGAPPDGFNPKGQGWGLPAFVPWKLRAAKYAPLIATFRANMAAGGGLRIDHAMGLFRLYCIPEGSPPTDGAYVRYPAGDLLDLLALEATRAGAFIVGEDLGTVEDGVHEELSDRRVMGCKVMWFEDDEPSTWPAGTLASISTHDLPTVAGVWTGVDVARRRELGIADEAGNDAMRRRLADHAGVPETGTVPEIILGAHLALAAAGSDVVLAGFEDALGRTEPPNIPGTIDEWPNWRIALPITVDDLEAGGPVSELAGRIDRAHRASTPQRD